MTSSSALEWTSQSMTGLAPPGQLFGVLVIPLSHAFKLMNPTWGLHSLQVPLTGGKVVGDEGVLTLEPLNLELQLTLPLIVAAVSLDLSIQSPIVELPGVSHQVMEPLSGSHEEPVIPDQHGLDQLVNDLSGGGMEGGDIHILIALTTCQEISLAIVVMAHPLGLHLEAVSDGDEGSDFTLIGFKIVRVHGCVLLFILCKLSTDLSKALLSSLKPPLEVLDLLHVIFVMLIEGVEEAIGKALQVLK